MRIDFGLGTKGGQDPDPEPEPAANATQWDDGPGFPIPIPVPGLRHAVGLGAAVAAGLERLGVSGGGCGGCKARAERLDQRVRFVPWG